MASLYQRGPVWWIAYYDRGRLVRKSLGTHKRTAEKVKADIEGRLVREEHGLAASPDLPVETARTRFKDAREGRASAAWFKVMDGRIAAFFAWAKEKAQVQRVKQVTAALLEEYLTHRHATEGLATAKKDFVILRTFFRWAERMGLVRESPLKAVTPLPTEARAPIRFLTREDAAALLAACAAPVEFKGRPKKENDGKIARPRKGALKKPKTRPRRTPLYEMSVVAIYAGLRLGEIVHLRWADVDFTTNGGVLHVKVSETFTPKDKESRRIPLHPKVAEVLKEYRMRSGRKSGLVFRTKKGKPYQTPNLFRELQAAVERAELEDVNWYTLRHTFASWLAMEGVSLHKIAKFLGHASVQTTERHYAGLVPEELQEDIRKL